MIDEEELRELMARMGYSPEEIAAACETRKYLKSLEEQMIELGERLRQWAELALGDAFGMYEMIEAHISNIELPKKEKRRRPPRYIGPMNKAPKWVLRPARMARSNCRKFKKR